MIDFLAWVDSSQRTYADVMEVWKGSCPRHRVFEDALADGLIKVAAVADPHRKLLLLTDRGQRTVTEPRTRAESATPSENSS